jgi:hypothetical protein
MSHRILITVDKHPSCFKLGLLQHGPRGVPPTLIPFYMSMSHDFYMSMDHDFELAMCIRIWETTYKRLAQ